MSDAQQNIDRMTDEEATEMLARGMAKVEGAKPENWRDYESEAMYALAALRTFSLLAGGIKDAPKAH